MKKTVLYSFLFILLAPIVSRAASGYYIKMNGDTVRGNFAGISDNGNPDSVIFTPANTQSSITLKPADIRSFRIGNFEYFVSYNGTRTLTIDGTNTTENIHVFLRQIGETNGYYFYTFSDAKGVTLFYEGKDSKVVELKRHEAAPNEVDDYHGQLRNMLSAKIDSAELSSMLHKVDYTDESLISFIDDVNDLTSVHASVPAMKGITLTGGYAYHSFVVDGNSEFPQVSTDYSSNGSWLAGVGYMSPLKKGGGRYFIYPNVQGFAYKTSGKVNDSDGVIMSGFKSDLVLFPKFDIGFNFVHKPGIKMYASVGFGALVLFDNTENYEKDFDSGTVVTSESTDTDVAFDISIIFGGVLFNRYMLFVGYNAPAAVSNNQYYTGYLSGVEVGVGVRL